MHVSTRAALLAATLVWATSASAQTYTLEEAVRTAVANSPQGEATAARLDGLNAARSAADTNPAPTIDGTVENIGTPGFSQWQIDGTYNQRLERGGKRAARVGLAQGDIAVAEAEALVRRLDLASEVQALYVEAQAAALSLELARSRVEIAETLANEVQRRVDEARDPLFAGTRARTQLAEARVDLGLAEHAFEAALARLALLTGGDPRSIGVVTSGFLEAEEIAITNADLTPVDLAVFQARRERADANYRLQEANSRTDPTVFAGPRLFGNGDVAVIAGFSLPLPNRALNRANIDRAAAEQRQVEADLAVERFQRRRQIALAAERVEEARHEAEAIQEQVVPGAEQTLREVRAGYNRGGFTFLDVSIAQTALHEARVRFVDALAEYHQAKVDYDRLTGRFIELVGGY
ncbi:TolC family protein [Qipengyuania citrea]|jgi:cobalt-zinc-cadmium efflux system outer membrane protein|uniref:TolC family protein n=1 Tax=Qipengyuania citrea TaxID=225971 RepID=A0ABY4U4N7_9SPHN|nr:MULTISPECIES: TolC family protein [Qipengyuania]MAS86335.1 metal transporter [Erythrobacteraceae bacterium]MBL4896570.1 TolC family protein [Erythrobacter sp.]MEE3216897.1 TolC family protein [Pseudomonadota bacterium]QPL40435.1 TolC family protein [Erythrobacter sp. A30-3]MBY8335362.1 TolC family protein [Qipengyuania pacifica]|tara:strand:+ start:760 stop:1983 length:1224 start_codon:yes stop_codon:yes gene_type:complete